MYNEELKRKFIDSYTDKESVKAVCVGTFNALEKIEREHDMDLCSLKTEDIQPVVSKTLGVRSSGHYLVMSSLKSYARWCLDNNVEGATENIFALTDDNLEKIKTQMVNSPMHLQKYLNALYYSEEDKTIDDTFRCFFWLAFAGMKEEKILDVRDSDVKFDSMIVVDDVGKEYPIYREALKAFKNCVILDRFVYKHPNYSKDVIRDRIPGHQLLRGIKNEANLRYIRVQISEKARKANNKGKTDSVLSYYRVWLSGMFYRMYQFELAGFEPNFEGMAKDFMDGKTYKLDSGRNLIGAKFRQITRDYKEDYERWKAAFIK